LWLLRADLYYRLSTFPVAIPPLRERREDILPLAESFRAQAEVVLRRHTAGFHPESLQLMRAYPWPGNVRELRNAVERSVLLTPEDGAIHLRLPSPATPTSDPSQDTTGSLDAQVGRFEREVIRQALLRHGGVIRRAAHALGVNAVTLGRRVKHHGLQRELAVENNESGPNDEL